MLGSLIVSMKVLQDNMMVTCSMLLIVIRSIDLFLAYFRVLCVIDAGYSAQFHDLSSGKPVLHPVRQASPRTVQSQFVGMTFLIGISQQKAVGNIPF